jgi:hypothetical protein
MNHVEPARWTDNPTNRSGPAEPDMPSNQPASRTASHAYQPGVPM